jgi:hypothetical protein
MNANQNLNGIFQELDKNFREQSRTFPVLKKVAKTFVRRRREWSIGIYVGKSPLDLTSSKNINNPVLTAKDVTDVPAEFVADPFMVHEDGTWYMFFEVLNSLDNLGDIALATSPDGFSWTYQKVVLDEPFHLSYPYVFKWNHEYYMVPETFQAQSVRLYKAVAFPERWQLVGTLLEGSDFVDSSLVYFQDRWWMFNSSTDSDILRLYYANDLLGPWVEHPKSPIVQGNSSIARPGGRVIVLDGKLIRYTQDDAIYYGRQVSAFEITEITTTTYHEKVNHRLKIGASISNWNRKGMHHVDPHQLEDNHWIACVDGFNLWWHWFPNY